LGLLYMAAGQFGQALENVEGSLALAESLGHKEWTVGNMYAVGHVHRCLNSLQKAESIFSDGLALAADLHSQHWFNVINGQLAELKLEQEDAQGAIQALRKVVTPDTPMDTLSKRTCWAAWGRLALLNGEPAKAFDIARSLLASLPVSSIGSVVPGLWALKGEALAGLGQPEKALCLFREAIITAEAWGYLPLVLKLHITKARICRQAGFASEADDALARARALGLQLAQTIPSCPLRERFLSQNRLELHRAMAD
jgi:tetratricopeptide (TPR) repeat protein